MLPSFTLVLGGAASGKSAYAENLIINSGLSCHYVATCQVLDNEMQTKIDIHTGRRGPEWVTHEAPQDLGQTLSKITRGAVLVDCATMWLTNRLMAGHDLSDAPALLLEELAHAHVPIVIVSNEIGGGIVPMDRSTRTFREAQGRVNIALAARADRVIQVVAGLERVLK